MKHIITYGILFASKTKTARWANGQNLMLRKVTFSGSKVGHSEDTSKCLVHDAIFQAKGNTYFWAWLTQLCWAVRTISTCKVQNELKKVPLPKNSWNDNGNIKDVAFWRIFSKKYFFVKSYAVWESFCSVTIFVYFSFDNIFKPVWIFCFPIFFLGLHFLFCHTEKLSPHPQVPVMLGLLKTNSEANFDSTKSISVPNSVNWAFLSMMIVMPSCSTISSIFDCSVA